MTQRQRHPGLEPEALYELVSDRDGLDLIRKIQEHRHSLVAHTGIESLPYNQTSIGRFVDSGGKARLLDALEKTIKEETNP